MSISYPLELEAEVGTFEYSNSVVNKNNKKTLNQSEAGQSEAGVPLWSRGTCMT
jgi:hypothetical protein